MDPELLSLDDMPADARELIDATEREIADIRGRVSRQTDEIRTQADRSIAELESETEDQVRERQLRLLQELKPMQEAWVRKGKLDEALAIRDHVRSLKAALLQANEDPGTLSEYAEERPGRQMLFLVTGSLDGTIWGTDVYTTDSALATAAVHAGALREGERGVVRVTVVESLNVDFVGTERNGVLSHSFGMWPAGFRVERV